MFTQYTSIDRIFAKLYRDLPLDNISEDNVIEWCGEALDFIGVMAVSEEAVHFTEVQNHQCKIPVGLQNIIQIGLNMCDKIGDDSFCPKVVAEEMIPDNSGPDVPVALNCQGEPVNAYELAYYRPFFDFRSEYFDWRNSYHYKKYSPVRAATGTGIDRIVCQERDEVNYGGHEYSVVQGQYLRFSFREGIVAIAHNRNITDPETGYPMIPDNISCITAITKYITMKLLERESYARREGSLPLLQKAEADWQWYCRQAGNEGFGLKGIDDFQNFLDQRSYILPDNSHYYTFFGNLGKPEQRKYNDPDGRNRSYRTFYGGN